MGVIEIFFTNLSKRVFHSIDNKIFIKKKSLNLGAFGKIEYNLFREKDPFLLGQFISGKIWLSERLFEVYSPLVQKYVVFHELGHKRSNKGYFFADFLGMFLFIFGVVFVFTFSIPLWFRFLFGAIDFVYFIAFLVPFLLIAVGKILKGLSESKADFFAIDNLSIPDYLKICKEKKDKRPKMGLFYFLIGLSYPKPTTVIWFYKLVRQYFPHNP